MRRKRLGMFPYPAFASYLFAVRFVMAILRHDVLWREGDDLGASWAHHNRCDGRVIIQRVPVRELTRETVGALDGLGGKVGRTIQCHQELIPEDSETVEQVMLGKTLKDGNKDGVEMAWGDRIEEGADVIITGDLRDTTQRVGVMAALWAWSRRWYSKNEGDWVKKMPQAPKAASGIRYCVLRPLRQSGNCSTRCWRTARRSSKRKGLVIATS